MNFKRNIFHQLIEWKESTNRKPLILRGARQVGKTTFVNEFSKSFNNRILLNLEKAKDIRFFEDYKDVSTIKDALFFEYNIPTKEIGTTLLFIDEIQ